MAGKSFLARLSEFVSNLIQVNEPLGGFTTHQRGPWQIVTGVDYTLPFPLPARMAEAFKGDDAKRNEWLEEVTATYRHQFATPYGTGTPFSELSIVDPLREWDWQTRRDVLEQCHLDWERDPIAKQAVAYNTLFAIQDGASIVYSNTQVRDLIEAFTNHPENSFKELEKGISIALDIDGEVFFRFFEASDSEGEAGEVIITMLAPWGIREIEHELGFFRRVEQYHYVITQNKGDNTGTSENIDEDIPAEEVLHCAINRLPYEQRGRPSLFVILPWLRAYKEWLENRARQNFWKAAFLWWFKLINATAAQVAAFRNIIKEPPTTGSTFTGNQNIELNAVTTPVGAADAADDGKAMKTQIAVGMGLPLYMLAEGADPNLATARAQQLPALRTFAERQDFMRDQVLAPMFRKVLQYAIDAGILDEEVQEEDAEGNPLTDTITNEDGTTVEQPRMIKALEAFDVYYPELERDDPVNLLTALQIAVTNHWIANETAIGLLPWGIDGNAERLKIDSEQEAEQQRYAQGLAGVDLSQFSVPPYGQTNQPPGGGQ